MLVLPAAHRLAERDLIDLVDLSDSTWIGGCPRCRGHLLELCDRSGFSPRIAFETDNVQAVLGLVAAGIGVAMLPQWHWNHREATIGWSFVRPPRGIIAPCIS